MNIKHLLPAAFALAILAGAFTAGAAGNGLQLGLQGKSVGTQKPAVVLPQETLEELKAKLPATYEETEKLIGAAKPVGGAVVPMPKGKYVMWTHDLDHAMQGRFANGFFIGKDSDCKRAWGVYGRELFVGFYDGKLFTGKYSGGSWKAEGLFGAVQTQGKYVTYPPLYQLQ